MCYLLRKEIAKQKQMARYSQNVKPRHQIHMFPNGVNNTPVYRLVIKCSNQPPVQELRLIQTLMLTHVVAREQNTHRDLARARHRTDRRFCPLIYLKPPKYIFPNKLDGF